MLLLVQSIVPNMKFRNNSFPLFLLLAGASAFAPLQAHNHARSLQKSAPQNAAFVLQSAETDTDTDTDTEASTGTGPNSLITVPVTFNEMIRDSSNAMRDAKSEGINRQIIRILLPRDPMSGNLGQYFEDDVEVEGGNRGTQDLLLAYGHNV